MTTPTSKKVWIKKDTNNCFVAYVALKAKDDFVWYLDSGCSRHMCGDKMLFISLEDYKVGSITFGDGGKASILGKGIVEFPGFLSFEDVLYVIELKVNLLSISQICDANFEVKFVKNKCVVLNSNGDIILNGVRTYDNCYNIFTNFDFKCINAKVDLTKSWHQRLGRLNYHDLSKVSKLVKGLPKLEKIENKDCGPCQLGNK